MSEKTEQKKLVQWFNYQYKPYKIIAIPNAQKFLSRATNAAVMINSMKAEGMVIGASDLFIAAPKGKFHGMFLEMKDVGKDYHAVTDVQRQFIADMIQVGYYAEWAAGFDIGRKIIINYMQGY